MSLVKGSCLSNSHCAEAEKNYIEGGDSHSVSVSPVVSIVSPANLMYWFALTQLWKRLHSHVLTEKKINGLSTHPWGTSVLHILKCEVLLPKHTPCYPSDRPFKIQLQLLWDGCIKGSCYNFIFLFMWHEVASRVECDCIICELVNAKEGGNCKKCRESGRLPLMCPMTSISKYFIMTETSQAGGQWGRMQLFSQSHDSDNLKYLVQSSVKILTDILTLAQFLMCSLEYYPVSAYCPPPHTGVSLLYCSLGLQACCKMIPVFLRERH